MKLIGFCGGNAVMKNFGMILVASAMLFAFGCDDGRDPGTDAGGIVLMDSGPMTGTDGGPMTGTDAGPMMMGGACRDPLPDLIQLNMDPMSMGTLLPRCTAATQTCIAACMDNACLSGCTGMDTTAGVDVGGGTILDCNLCFNVQLNKCADNACPTQFADLRCCAEANSCADLNNCPACSTESTALNTCLSSGFSVAGCAPLTDGCFP